MAEVDRSILAVFLEELHELLRKVMFDNRSWVEDGARADFLRAWETVEPRFYTLVEELRFLADEGAQSLDRSLETAGLTGAELELKIGGWRRALRRFGVQPVRKALIKTLGWANLILGSLAVVLPHAEAVKEFKDAFEKSLDDVPTGARALRRLFRRR
jgi:hypothetical protein